MLARQLIEPQLQRSDAARDESSLSAVGDLVRLQRLENRLQIVTQSRLLTFERIEPPADHIMHERLKPAHTGQSVEAFLHLLAGNEPGAEAANEGLDRWLDGEVKQQQATRCDEWRGDEKDLNLRRKPVD